MEGEYFQSGDPRGWTNDELTPGKFNCRCRQQPLIDECIDAEFDVIDEEKMIEEKK